MNQRWEEGKVRWRSDRETIRPSDYEVAEIPNDRARAFIETHHYSKDYPAPRYRFGLHRHGTLVGVAVFSQPVNNRTITNVFPVHYKEGVELGRLVLLDEVPGNGESWFCARAFAELKKKDVVDREGNELRGILGVVSFSDPMPRRTLAGEVVMPGHVGTIYQALGALYLGRADARILRLFPDGRVFSHRTETKIASRDTGWEGAVRELQAYGAGPLEGDRPQDLRQWISRWLPKVTRPLAHAGNHKYVWSIHAATKNLPPGAAYPKAKDTEVA